MIGRLLFIGVASIALSACATPARVENMVVAAGVAEARSDLVGGLCVTEVTGGEETNPLWTSEVDDASFRAALEQSLRNNRLAAGDAGDCRYNLEANLLGLAQPIAGFGLEVTSHVNYSVQAHESGDPYYLTTVTAVYTGAFDDAFAYNERLRLANEGAIRRNIEQFISRLLAHEPSSGEPSGTTESETAF